MQLKYECTRLLVLNFTACYRFYRDVMGFRATFGMESDAYADFDTGEVTLALFDRTLMSAAVSTNHLPAESGSQDKVCFIFGVEDVDVACQDLMGKGVQMIDAPKDYPDWGIRAAHFRDPDENLIEIYHPLTRQ